MFGLFSLLSACTKDPPVGRVRGPVQHLRLPHVPGHRVLAPGHPQDGHRSRVRQGERGGGKAELRHAGAQCCQMVAIEALFFSLEANKIY